MAKGVENQLAPLMTPLGFAPESRQSWTQWRYVGRAAVSGDEGGIRPKPKKAAKGQRRSPVPWRLEIFELAERKGTLSVHKLAMALDQAHLTANLRSVTKKYFGSRAGCEIVWGRAGEAWCLFEFTRPGTRDKSDESPSQGVGGFLFRLAVNGATAAITVSDYFGVGYLPSNFAAVALRYVADALGLKALAAVTGHDQKGESIFELTFPVTDPALAAIVRGIETDVTPGETAAMVSLREMLAHSRHALTSTLVRDGFGWRLDAPYDDGDVKAGFSAVSYVPIEVLESRERSGRYREIDVLIQQGKSQRASMLAVESLRRDKDSLYLMRRLGLLGITGRKDRNLDFVDAALAREPENKLFLSYAVSLALEGGDHAKVLAHLSRLGGRLMSELDGLESARALDVVLPETLGDAWRSEDPDKAEDCYHLILQRRGDLPRILRKLVDIASSAGRLDDEIAYLHRLAGVERRRLEQAKIYVRLAELRQKQPAGREDAINLSLKALKLDRANHEAALFSAALLVEQGKPEEAIQLLDGLLRDPSLQFPPKARGRIEALIARTWAQSIGRYDLAETRYEHALENDPHNVDALKELETIYRRNNRVSGLAALLEAQFAAFETNGDSAALHQVFDELVTLYRGVLGQPARALDLYQRMLAHSSATPDEIERVLTWGDVELDWRDLYEKLARKIPAMPPGEQRAHFLCRLSDICREKLGEDAAAMQHALDALSEGFIDPHAFEFLCGALSQAQDHATLSRCYELRLEQVDDEERRRLMLELLTIPDALSDARRDQLAVQAYLLDANDPKALQQRFGYYRSIDAVDGIDQLLGAVLAETSLSGYQRDQWVRQAISAVEGCIDESRFAVIDKAYRLLVETSEDATSVLQDALASLAPARQPQRHVFYVVRLLEAGIVPALPERDVTMLLAGLDRELALYHQLMSFKATQVEVAAQHARTAAALYAGRPDEELNTERMLSRLCALVPCSDADLQQLRGLVASTGNWTLLAKSLQKQVDIESDRQRRFELLDQLGQVYWRRLNDLPRARLTYILALKSTPSPYKTKLLLATLAREAGDAKQEKKALVEFLMDPQCTLDVKSMSSAVRRLVELGEDGRYMQRIVLPYIEAAVASAQHDAAGQICMVLLENNLATLDIYKTAFKAAVVGGNEAQSVEVWWRGLALVTSKSSAKAYIAESRLVLEREGRRPLLLACFQAALDKGICDKLGSRIKQEILILYGAQLFDSDSERRKALDVYQAARTTDPEDSRSWMPLYFLLLEFGSPAKRLMHLREILPRLEQDQRPLKPFPLTIESLRAELKELEEQCRGVNMIEEAAAASFGDEDEVSQVGLAPALRAAGEPETFAGREPDSMSLPNADGEGGGRGRALAVVASAAFLTSEDSRSGADEDESTETAPLAPLDFMVGAQTEDEPESAPQSAPAPEDDAVSRGIGSLASDEPPALAFALEPEVEAEPVMPIELDMRVLPVEGDGSLSAADESAGETESAGLFSLELAAPAERPFAEMPAERSFDLGEDANATSVLPDSDSQGGVGVEGGYDETSAVPVSPTSDISGREPSGVTHMAAMTFGFGGESSDVSTPSAPEASVLGGTANSSYGTSATRLPGVTDWRAAVLRGKPDAALTESLLQQAFASELEKHLAIQAVALAAGACDRLDDWHWRVWRNAEEFGYALSGKDRYPDGYSSAILHSSLHKLLVAGAPLLVKAQRERFTVEYLAKRMQTTVPAIEKARKQLSWTDGLLGTVGFKHYRQRIADRRYVVYGLPGLGRDIFYEGSTRSLYIDDTYYRKTPPSHLFHRILGLLWSVRTNYFVLLALNPQKHVLPVLVELHQNLGTQGLSRLTSKITSKHSISKHLQDVDTRQLKSLVAKVGVPNEQTMSQLWEAMRMHVYRLLLAETLDLIGVFESFLDRDLLKRGALRPGEIYELTPFAKGLIDFVTKLKV